MLKKASINIIGAGKVGQTLGRLFYLFDVAEIAGIVNSNYQDGQIAQNFIGSGYACESFHDLKPADITLLTVPDDLIVPLFSELAMLKKFQAGNIIIHCSGSLSSKIFPYIATLPQLYFASVHPLKSFADPETSVESFAGTYCAFEGNEEVANSIKSLFTQIGGKIFSIPSEQKTLYHAAAVIASNYLVTLFHTSITCMIKAGIEKTQASSLTHHLMTGTLNNLIHQEPKNALTGPLKRGDYQTVEQHLIALKDTSFLEIYKNLSQITLDIAELTFEQKKSLNDLFSF